MLRSMYSGIAGMKGFQTKLDVVGNNIANVNTYGFKKGRVSFQDMMSQTMQGAQTPTGTRGGINPKQVGTGSQIGSIDTIHTGGFRQTTLRELDVMIEGDGMFALQMGNERVYTRSGYFFIDGSNPNGGNSYLTSADGFYVLDTGGNPIEIPKDAGSFSIQQNGIITYELNGNIVNGPQIGLAVFPNPDGLEKIGGSLYRNTGNTGLPLNVATLTTPEQDGAGKLIGGALEMSNVDLAEEFTEMITAQRGFQANTRIITTSDEVLQELVNLKR